jgi:hypothetical protein
MELNDVSSQSAGFNEHVESGAWFPPGYFTRFPECADPS